MKQLRHPLTSGTGSHVPARRPAASVYARAPRAARVDLGSPVTGLTSLQEQTASTKGRFCHLGSTGLMVIPTNAHRRPPETPT